MIATVINFCTNESLFLNQCIEEALLFSDQVLVVICDHFFDGSREDEPLLQSIYAAHPEVEFIQYAWSRENFYGRHSPKYWHNISRMLGSYFVRADIEYILFLDVDEIVEGKRFAAWLKIFPLKKYTALRFENYWYFREPSWRAKQTENSPTMVLKSALHYDAFMYPTERGGIFHALEGKKEAQVKGNDQLPMVHHYSWVRSKEALLKKVSAWGHRGERNWEELIETEFSRPFSGQDFVHGYAFIEVEPYLRSHHYTLSRKKVENVRFLTTREVHKIDLQLKFELLL